MIAGWNEGHTDAGAWFLCERCGERIEGRNGYEVAERLVAHRLERHNPELSGVFVSQKLAGHAGP